MGKILKHEIHTEKTVKFLYAVGTNNEKIVFVAVTKSANSLLW
jgi:hypothetical protein